MDKQQNDFMLMRHVVSNVVSQYKELRKCIGWKDSGKSATILRLANPFLTGYFTIAVAGKMSAGKSTFINSLIGENLLPTGHFQTTSCITWVISSEKRYMEVTFADGKTKTFTENLADELLKLVAVPPKFQSLPINHINSLIRHGDNIAIILGRKDGIEKMTHTSANDSLWRDYVASTSKDKIADKVEIHLPLPDEYKGWRIVDTPGVGAIGGIQDATKKLFTSKEGEGNANVVDAVVLLHKGTENIEDESANSFAEDVGKSMGDLAKGRLFFVLTHAGEPTFLNNKEGIMKRAEVLFGKRLNIPSERVTYVDGLINRFLVDAKKSRKDFSDIKVFQNPLEGWSHDDWNTISSAFSPCYMNMRVQGKEVNNNTLFAELEVISRFSQLRDMLYDFLNQEKKKAFSELLTLIKSELDNYGVSLRRDINSVCSGKAEIEKQIEGTKREKTKLSTALNKVQQKATEGQIWHDFNFIDDQLQKLRQLQSIGEVRTQYLQIIDKALSAEKELFKTLISEFSQYSSQHEINSVTFESIDFGELERQAGDKAASYVEDKSRPVKKLIKEGCCLSDDEWAITYPHTKRQEDFDKKRKYFTDTVISEGQKYMASFKYNFPYL